MNGFIEKRNCSTEFLNDGQYKRNGILRYEKVFGRTFVSTGGKETTEVCVKYFGIRVCVFSFDVVT